MALSELVLRKGLALLRSQPEPLRYLDLVLGYAAASLIIKPQGILCASVPPLSRLSVQLYVIAQVSQPDRAVPFFRASPLARALAAHVRAKPRG